nr:uncharacterized protein LOC111838074 [Paramormyrops kingsleyae]
MMFRLLLLLCLGHCLPAVLGVDSCIGTRIDAHIEGNAMLPCNGSAVTDMNNILWLFNGVWFGYIENGEWKADPRYTLPSIEQKNFSLVINRVKEKDGGKYTCRNDIKDQIICLSVTESQTQTPVTPTKGVSTGGWNQTVSVLPTPVPPPPAVIVVIVLVVLVVAAVGAAVLIKLWQKHQTDENPTDCIQFFHACGKEGEKNRGKNLPDPGPSEDALI